MSGDYEGMEQQMLTQLKRAEEAEAARDAMLDSRDYYRQRARKAESERNALQAKLAATQAVLAERERELQGRKGPCSNTACRLHYAHAGPCAS